MYINTDITDITVYQQGKCFIFVNYKTIIPFARTRPIWQPRSQALPSCGGKTLVGAGHVAPRFWILN